MNRPTTLVIAAAAAKSSLVLRALQVWNSCRELHPHCMRQPEWREVSAGDAAVHISPNLPSWIKVARKSEMNFCALFLLIGCLTLTAQDKVSKLDKPLGMKSAIVANGAMWAGAGLDIGTSWRQAEGNALLAGKDGRFGERGLVIKGGINLDVTVVTVVLAKKWPRTRRAMTMMNGISGGVQAIGGLSNLAK